MHGRARWRSGWHSSGCAVHKCFEETYSRGGGCAFAPLLQPYSPSAVDLRKTLVVVHSSIFLANSIMIQQTIVMLFQSVHLSICMRKCKCCSIFHGCFIPCCLRCNFVSPLSCFNIRVVHMSVQFITVYVFGQCICLVHCSFDFA